MLATFSITSLLVAGLLTSFLLIVISLWDHMMYDEPKG